MTRVVLLGVGWAVVVTLLSFSRDGCDYDDFMRFGLIVLATATFVLVSLTAMVINVVRGLAAAHLAWFAVAFVIGGVVGALTGTALSLGESGCRSN